MAPRETPKPTLKIQRNVSLTKTPVPKKKSSPVNVIKKTTSARNITDKRIGKVTDKPKGIELKQRTNSVPKVTTPKSKENKPTVITSSISKSAKKALWKRRPKPAHSGVPLPEKMKRLLEQQFEDSD